MTIQDWFAGARDDAERRGLPGLGPLLEALAASTRALRSVDWDSAGDARPADGGPDRADPAGGERP